VVWQFDLSQVGESFRDANYIWSALALVLSTSTRVIDTWRWRLYLRKVGQVPLWGLLGAFLIGNLGNNVLPMRAGDVAKIQIVANRYGLSRAGLASSVFVVESVMDGMTFLILLLVGLALMDIGFIPPAMLWSLGIMAGGGFVATVIASHFLPRRIPSWWWLKRLPKPVLDVLAEGLPRFLDGMETMRDMWLLIQAVVLNFAGWFSQVVVFWVFGLAFGLDLGLDAYIVVMVAANLVAAFPIAFQNLGPYELLIVQVLAAWDVEEARALAYAVGTHMLTNLWVVALGIGALWAMRVRPGELFSMVGQRKAIIGGEVGGAS